MRHNEDILNLRLSAEVSFAAAFGAVAILAPSHLADDVLRTFDCGIDRPQERLVRKVKAPNTSVRRCRPVLLLVTGQVADRQEGRGRPACQGQPADPGAPQRPDAAHQRLHHRHQDGARQQHPHPAGASRRPKSRALLLSQAFACMKLFRMHCHRGRAAMRYVAGNICHDASAPRKIGFAGWCVTVVTACQQALIDISTEQRWLGTARTTMSLVQSIVQVRRQSAFEEAWAQQHPCQCIMSSSAENVESWLMLPSGPCFVCVLLMRCTFHFEGHVL